MPSYDSTSSRKNPDWRLLGKCREHDPELWFPPRGGSSKQARAICRTCPVLQTCRQWAIDHNEAGGVWGDTNERERRALRRLMPPEEALVMPSRRQNLVDAAPLREVLMALLPSFRSRRAMSHTLAYRCSVGRDSVSGFLGTPTTYVTEDWARKICAGTGYNFTALYPDQAEQVA